MAVKERKQKYNYLLLTVFRNLKTVFKKISLPLAPLPSISPPLSLSFLFSHSLFFCSFIRCQILNVVSTKNLLNHMKAFHKNVKR